MKFPNLAWSMKQVRLTNYRLAAILGMGESKFSRSMNGLSEFTPQQKRKISEVLSYPKAWLFAEVRPPQSSVEAEPAATRA